MTDELVKASLTHMGSFEKLDVLWNPEHYRVSRRSQLAAGGAWGAGHSPLQAVVGGVEEFRTDLFLDATRRPPDERDLRSFVERLEAWMVPDASRALPDPILFAWGRFRFRGVLSELDQVWERFDPDGTPVRGWIRLVLVR